MRSRRRTIWLMSLALLTAGCGQDAEVLARLGRKSWSKLEALGHETANQLGPRIEAARAGCPDPTLAARVSCRLRWDQSLEGAAIEVHAAEGKIELTGTVMNPTQRQKAIELAETTVGVEQVLDSLTLPDAPQ